MHEYRTHQCGALRKADIGKICRLSGWVHRKRDHGNLLFIDLRDNYGITQCVTDISSAHLKLLETVKSESVICVTGLVVARPLETVNPKLPTGDIEVKISDIKLLSSAILLLLLTLLVSDIIREQKTKSYLTLRLATC